MTNDSHSALAGRRPIPRSEESNVNQTLPTRRPVVAAALVAAPLLMMASTALMPPFAADHAQRLVDLHDAGAAAAASNVLFILTQIPMLLAFVGIASLIGGRMPRLALVVTGIGLVATFCEAVMGGTGLVWTSLAGDPANRATYAEQWEQFESSPAMLFGVLGFLGTVLTLVLAAVGLWRTRVVPIGVPLLIAAFVVLEFAGSAVSEYASYAAVSCLLVAFGVVARVLWLGAEQETEAPSDRVTAAVSE
jgi:hypothetical protein